MLTSDERYAQQAESMRQALANAWAAGYAACDRDWQFTYDIVTPDEDRAPTPNPYVKEN